MHAFTTCALFMVLRFLTAIISPAEAVPVAGRAASSYWLSDIKRQGTVAYGNSNHQIFRNVRDFGATGDGVTDDTAAINSAISSGGRCGQGCDSNTVTPALVYFPPGDYLVSKPIIQYYYTQLVGDAITLPTIVAASGFSGMAVIDSDPYDGPANWYGNTNNFFRQIRNFKIDLKRHLPVSTGTGIHWQVAQATSLQNIQFDMHPKSPDNKQQGIFMDNGSGGFMTDLTFNGGNYGAFFGNQQFTTRNLKFNDCNTAIYMNWNWGWTLKSVDVNGCGIGIDMSNNPSNQTVGSVILMDSHINADVGVKTAYSDNSIPPAGGTLVLDNVRFEGSVSVQSASGAAVLTEQDVVSWVQGSVYDGRGGHRTGTSGEPQTVSKPPVLLSNGGAVFEKAKPQYENYPSSSFISVKDNGAKGDGVTDDTQAIQNIMNKCQNGGCEGKIIYFDHGAYVVSDTITIPGDQNIKITGEIWPLIMANGKSGSFNDQNNPKPVFQVGTAGQAGSVEISDLMFETLGPAPGAIMMEWNSPGAQQGANGLWDVHFRIGGTQGTGLQSDTCAKSPAANHDTPNPACQGAYMLFHATNDASVYLENTWFWVADHELDLADHGQIDIYNGRGVLIESKKAMWLYGTSSEHSVLYNYQLDGASNVFMGMIQTETPYFQSNPQAPIPFTPRGNDPQFGGERLSNKAWGLRIINQSSNVLVYGGGLYSFFENYDQTCLQDQNCQTNMVEVKGSSNVYLFALSTKASENMITSDVVNVKDSENRSNFCATVALFKTN